MPLVEITKLTKQFRKGDEVITPLNEVNMTVEQGEFVSLMGASGSAERHRRHRPTDVWFDRHPGN
jgi:putative ABC transport system ATP-binding protein